MPILLNNSHRYYFIFFISFDYQLQINLNYKIFILQYTIDFDFLSSHQLQTFQRIPKRQQMAAIKNITNGQFQLDFDAQDKVNENYRFIRVPNADIYDIVRRRDPNLQSKYYIENLRTGSFSQISQKYQLESKTTKRQQAQFTTNSFQTEMILLKTSIETKLSKSISFFQGIFVGMALLFTITLNLSSTVSPDLVRVEDHSIRVVSLLTTFGSFFSLIRSRDRYLYIKLRGNSTQVDQRYKTFVLSFIQMLLYTCSYIVFNISHTYAVQFNISGTGYRQLSILTSVYTALCIIGWIITNVNTKKHQK